MHILTGMVGAPKKRSGPTLCRLQSFILMRGGRPPPVCGSRFVVGEGDRAPAYRCAKNLTAFRSGSRGWSKETVGKER